MIRRCTHAQMVAPLKLRQSPGRLERFVRNIRETNVILDADQFTIVFEAIREIMRPVVPPKRAIGFGSGRPTLPGADRQTRLNPDRGL